MPAMGEGSRLYSWMDDLDDPILLSMGKGLSRSDLRVFSIPERPRSSMI